MRSITLNCAVVVVALQRANCAFEAGAYPYAGAYAKVLWLRVVLFQAFLPAASSIC